ncbi:COG3650 family protein [Sphingobium cloacae]|uniref:COG3650 family protein n=1 Tax=Sphingobium cloacae TaxID=120107 RepID=UPI000B125403|nr:membrane-like protein [Sphingobium cloacae]
MRVGLPLLAALALAGCGGEDRVPANEAGAGGAAVNGALIADRRETMNEMAKEKGFENPAPAVPRGTSAVSDPDPRPEPREVSEYRAIGTEPFWAVRVRGSVATLERPDKPPARFAVARADDRRTVRYLGEEFSMTVSEGPCSDGMSDSIWSDRVQIAFGEGTLKGCGGERDDGGMGPP